MHQRSAYGIYTMQVRVRVAAGVVARKPARGLDALIVETDKLIRESLGDTVYRLGDVQSIVGTCFFWEQIECL